MDKDFWDILNRLPLDFQREHMRHTCRQMTPAHFDALMDMLIRFLRLIPPGCSGLEKATLLYHVVSQCLTYDFVSAREKAEDERQGYTYAGAVLNGTAVCNGISQLYAKLCQACGIPCNIVEGYANDPAKKSLHAWVQIQLPDETGALCTYHCDPTWDLQEFRCTGSFRYFLKSDAYMIAHGHCWDTDRGKAQGKPKFIPCPRDWDRIPSLPEESIALMCRFFKNMKQPERFILPV